MKGLNTHLTIDWRHLTQVLNRYGDYFIQQARTNLGRNHSYASGNLGDTMEKIITIDERGYKVEIKLADYWEYVENGRKPGKFPPVNRIREWIMIKPVHPRPMNIRRKWKTKDGSEHSREVTITPTVPQLTYLIGRKIKDDGIPARPFFRPAKDDTYRYFEEAIYNAIKEDIETWIVEKVDYRKMLESIL